MAALRECNADLVKFWGFDPEAQSHLKHGPEPVGLPTTWLRSQDYPAEALAELNSAIVHFRIDIDAAGKPVSCHILSATKGPDFAKVTCAGIVSRATFLPALDAKGAPIASYYISAVQWKIYP